MPYRIYDIAGKHYFEFFSMPYDTHRNPAEIKGVIFDTNRRYDETAVWDMLGKKRVAAYGDAKYFADRVKQKDIVFFSHKWNGIICAAEVIGPTKEDRNGDERYH